MAETFQHLGIYSDIVDEARKQRSLYPSAPPGEVTRKRLREILGFCDGPEAPINVQVDQHWEKDGLEGEIISWWVGYGPRTQAYLLKPAGVRHPLPGIVALHDHSGFKFYGKEKIADGPGEILQVLADFRAVYYESRAYVNALAREGFIVLAHDTFLWGSRKFSLDSMPEHIGDLARLTTSTWPPYPVFPPEIAVYNEATGYHEHLIEKYCNLLGTTMAGVVCHEDRVALNYLLSRPELDPNRVGCVGLSGGGNRAALLLATHERVKAAVIVGLMTTYEHLLDHNVWSHTWMLFPSQWARYGDWPDIAASRAPNPLLVQYDLDDDLFTPQGMETAHQRITGHYASVGHPEAYQGQFYPGPHKFNLEMQAAAFGWLKQHLE